MAPPHTPSQVGYLTPSRGERWLLAADSSGSAVPEQRERESGELAPTGNFPGESSHTPGVWGAPANDGPKRGAKGQPLASSVCLVLQSSPPRHRGIFLDFPQAHIYPH